MVGLSHDHPSVRRKKWKSHDKKAVYKGRLCLCVRRCFEVSEPSRQKKWVTIKQEVTWPQGKGGGDWVRLPFPVVFHSVSRPDLAIKCVRTRVQLYFLKDFSAFLQLHVQTDGRKSLLLVYKCLWAPVCPFDSNSSHSVLVVVAQPALL